MVAKSIEDSSCYRIIVDEIPEGDTDLVNRDNKFQYLTLGFEIDLPNYGNLFN